MGALLLSGWHAAAAESLDIAAYLEQADGERIYPSARQIEMLREVMPPDVFQVAPPIGDRGFWDAIAESEDGRAYFARAVEHLDQAPEIPISDEIYREANAQGNRPMYKPRYYRTMERLEWFILAECLENRGRFLPQIEVYSNAIMDMKSWLHPNHDRGNRVLDGKAMKIDLGARKFGSVLVIADALLGDRLPGELRQRITAENRRRIIDSYFSTCRGDDKENHWIVGTSNWNSVCTSGAVFITIASSPDAEERLAAIGCTLNSMKSYLEGFGDDGYCSEGIGYWGYGFGHYLYLAHILYDYTDGRVDLFTFDNPEKIDHIAHFPGRFQIHGGMFPAFSDSNITNPSDFANFARAMTAKYYDSPWSFKTFHESSMEQLIQWGAPLGDGSGRAPSPPGATHFETSGIVVSRGSQEVPLSIVIKAGHNAENHNHNDVGSYGLLLGQEWVAGDIGKPVYIKGAFSSNNKARNSWGHPVPRVDGKLQSKGRRFEGRVLDASFSEGADRVLLDLAPAYEVPALKRLERVMEHDKSGAGTVAVEDRFEADEPIAFGTAVMTYAVHEFVDDQTIMLDRKGHLVELKISSRSEPKSELRFTVEEVPVRLGSGQTAYRLGIDFREPVQSGSIAVRFTPVRADASP